VCEILHVHESILAHEKQFCSQLLIRSNELHALQLHGYNSQDKRRLLAHGGN